VKPHRAAAGGLGPLGERRIYSDGVDPLVTVDWLAAHLDDPSLRILDCTVAVTTGDDGRWDFQADVAGWATAHVPGAAYADLRGALSDPDSRFTFTVPLPERFAEAMGSLGIGGGTSVVLYDRTTGGWAARVWWLLRAFGFDDAAVLDGGLTAWRRAGQPTTTDPPTYPPATFEPRPRPELLADREEIQAAMRAPATCLVDTLDRAAYLGERLASARRGHIPGAVNLPYGGLNDPDTMVFLPDDELAARIAAVVGPRPQRVITYCGSGIAAAAAAFTMHRLGYPDVAVYDGGMEEWADDPGLPVETGDPSRV
jgi:thiosulfate/3-mercaptopyruvate sulfurtransferase